MNKNELVAAEAGKGSLTKAGMPVRLLTQCLLL